MLEHLCVLLTVEVPVFPTGPHIGQHDAIDELLQAPLAGIGTYGTAEVLGGNDGGGVHAPKIWKLDAALFEDHLAGLPVVLHNITALPRDVVIRMYAGGGEQPLDMQSGAVQGVVHELFGCGGHL